MVPHSLHVQFGCGLKQNGFEHQSSCSLLPYHLPTALRLVATRGVKMSPEGMYVSVGVTPSRKISLPSLDMGVQSTAARRLDEEWYLLMPNHILRARDCTMVRYSNDLGVSLNCNEVCDVN